MGCPPCVPVPAELMCVCACVCVRHPDHDLHAVLKTPQMFVDEWHASVGLGSNILMGMTADRRGLLPANDVAKITRVGEYLRRCYAKPIAANTSSASGGGGGGGGAGALQLRGPGDFVELAVPKGKSFDRVWLREDITTGQRALGFRVLARRSRSGSGSSGSGLDLAGFEVLVQRNGTSVARKRIELLNATLSGVEALRFQVTEAVEWPVPMKEVAAFAPCGKV